jgi:dTDP-4-dehydrorhamnose reductase
MTPAKVYHLVPSGELSWHQFAETILARAREAGLGIRATKVTPITTADYPTPAKRPLNSRLDCSRFERTFGIELDDWRVGFEKVMLKLSR